MKRKQNNAGFSLVEVILSMAILAIISIPLLSYFSDSMKYNAKMADKQHATATAQELLEQLKNEDKLVKKDPADPSSYTVPFLYSKGYLINGVNTLSASGGGSAVFTGTASASGRTYDAEVTVSTTPGENAVPVPEINGVDDTKDVIAAEGSQFQEALVHFKAVNAAYGGTPMTTTEIRQKMVRTINIDIQPSGSEYRVKVGCSYTCKNLRGTGSLDSYDCTPFAENQLSSVRRVYLLFKVIPDNSSLIQDVVNITAPSPIPELQLICQNKTSMPGSYTCQITGSMPTTVATNVDKGSLMGRIMDNFGYIMSGTKNIVEKNPKIRKVDIEVKIYKAGHTAGAEPYITVNATKGE